MLQDALIGAAAGAVGTVALDVATYTDMALRGRPSSNTPATLAGILAGKVGLSLSSGNAGSNDEVAQNRKSGLGALLGYLTGLGVGTAYGLLRSQLDDLPGPLAGVGVGLAAMAASDVPIVISGASDPTKWGLSGWAADAIPHLIYGLVTVAVFEAFTNRY